MVLTKVGFFLVLVTILTSDAFNTLTPWDKEAIYDWKALVKSGTHLPTPYASQFTLQGKIHLQSNNNSTFVQITDLTYHLYNGILDHVHELEPHDLPLPEEVQHFSNVFKIVYNEEGLATGIVTKSGEKEFSRNIKKAIATILQMKKSVVDKVYRRSEAFVTKEDSIYGHGLVDYTVVPRDGDVVEVHKMHDMADSRHLFSHFVTNTESGRCDVDYEHNNMIMHDSNKKYVFVKQDGHHIAKEIVANGAIVYYPFQAQSDSQFILVNQTFSLVDVVPVKEEFHITQEHFEDNLAYHAYERSQDDIVDVTNGRHVVNYEKLVPLAQAMLKDIPQYLQENHINTEEHDSKRGQLVNRIQKLLLQFNLDKLQELKTALPEDALNIFYHILPLVSTDASALYIKNLIVKKQVDDDVAVTLLQHMSDNIAPTLHLLDQLEELIHLDETFSWNVRKVAILTFGSLIHKSYIHTKKANLFKKHDYDDQQPYEKYINQYLSNLKKSQDFKTQSVYIHGLYNIKLPSLIKHLVPTFNGELWQEEQLRFLGLWTAGAAIVNNPNPNTIIETLWPIFTNQTELTEMRIMSYYYIMLTQPSHSRLRNIFSLMLHEPNQEMYNFHYTYLQSVMQSTNPCRQEMRVKLAQVLKLTPPPVHGTSSASFYNYKDVNYEFGAEVEEYFVKTNRSRFHAFILNSQHFGRFQEEYLVYLIVRDGHRGPPTFKNSVLETVVNILRGSDPTTRFEAGVVKRGQVLNTFYFDKDNIHEIDDLIESLKEKKVLIKDWLYVNYHWYHKALIPTDLGIPAHWEFLMPGVHQNKLKITSDDKDDGSLYLHVENKYVNWLHYRHGLSFYNPISDVWQGVNRFHSYDAALPINFDFTFNSWATRAQLSWKKKNDTSMSVAGLRTHVKQMVFIEGLHNQSSPHVKNFQIVSHGKQYRHDYTLVDEDNLITGHKWYMGLFDSDVHVSNGSVKHELYLIAQSNGKHYNSPFEHLALALHDFYGHVVLMPHPGTYGFVIKVEPSHKYPVTNIDLTYTPDFHSDSSNYYFPGYSFSSNLTYAVRNKEQSLKTWDVNAVANLHPGHTLADFKIYLTRIISGQKDYKMCVEGVKKWTLKKVTGHLTVGLSHTCGKDAKVIDVTMTGQRSLEQKDGHHKYGSCQYVIPYSVPHYHTLQCLISHSTLRHYVYDVKTTNIPSEFQKTFINWWDQLKSYYHSYYLYDHDHNEDIGDNNLKIDVVFPMQADEIDIHIKTPQHVHELSGIPAEYWSWFGLSPDSVAVSRFFKMQHDNSWLNHCRVYHDHHYTLNGDLVSGAVPDNWTLYLENKDRQIAVYLKRVANTTMAMKVVDGEHTLEISPNGGSYRIVLDGNEAPLEEQRNEDWFSYHVFTQGVDQEVALIMQRSRVHFKYDAHHVVILTLRSSTFTGHCSELH